MHGLPLVGAVALGPLDQQMGASWSVTGATRSGSNGSKPGRQSGWGRKLTVTAMSGTVDIYRMLELLNIADGGCSVMQYL
jgi:hypothetical protein